MQMNIRCALPHDHERHVKICNQLSKTDLSVITAERYADYISNLPHDMKIFVICDTDDQALGILTVLLEKKLIRNFGLIGHIEDVVVDKAYRGLGLGKMLIDHAICYAKMKGCYKIILDCSDSNIKFYEKNGISRVGNQMALYFEG